MLIFQIPLGVISVFAYLHIVRYEPSKACVRVYGLDFSICPRQIFHSLEYQNDDNSLKKNSRLFKNTVKTLLKLLRTYAYPVRDSRLQI